MKLSLILVLLIPAGCATTGEVRQKTPVMSETSQRSLKEIVGCSSDSLASRRLIWTVIPRPNGASIILGETANPDLVADLGEDGPATSIKIYRQPRMYFGLSRAFIDIIRGCAGLPLINRG